ncbi:MAG: hypothetical protein ACW96U_06530 [Candidatus Heimdallarchaeaceae archaeon]
MSRELFRREPTRRKPSKKILLIMLALYLTAYGLVAWVISWLPSSVIWIVVLEVAFTLVSFLSIIYTASLITDWSPNFFPFKKKEDLDFDSQREILSAESIIEEQKIDDLICYNCKDVFVENEILCDKCGSPRPNCIICGLVLSPETDSEETVVITPCCSVYVHLEHILEWLEVKEECPNCKMEIIREDFFEGYNF